MVQVLKNLGLKKRYPRITIFLARRFDSQDPWGLSATIAGFGILFGLWFFLSVLQDIIAKDPLVILNIRLHNTMILFRTAGVTQFMLILTQLGSSTFLLLLCLGIVMFALANQQRRLAITFILAGISTSVISVTLKSIFNYARPIDAIISVNEASFPSGHMLSSTVIY